MNDAAQEVQALAAQTWQQKGVSYALCATGALLVGFALGSFSATPADAEGSASDPPGPRTRMMRSLPVADGPESTTTDLVPIYPRPSQGKASGPGKPVVRASAL